MAASEDVVVVVSCAPSQATDQQQKQIVVALMSRGIDGLAITPLNPKVELGPRSGCRDIRRDMSRFRRARFETIERIVALAQSAGKYVGSGMDAYSEEASSRRLGV